MTRLGFLLFTSLLTTTIVGDGAFAAEAIDPCKSVYEEIVPLRVPDFDQVAIWKKISGIKGIDRPRSMLAVVDGGQIVIGASTAYDEKTGLADTQIQMVRTDQNGKIIVEKWVPVKNLKTVADAVLLKDRIVVVSQLGTKDTDYIGLDFLNGTGEDKASKIISDPDLRYIPKSVMTVPGGSKMIIAAEAISRKNEADSYTVLIWVDKDGTFLTRKEYLPGVRNKPEYVGRMPNGEMVVTGRVMVDDGRDAGWVLRLSQRGDIIYQRSYARGGDSVLRRAIALDNGQLIVVGDALPTREGDKAAWVMRIDAEGNTIWQKYLSGAYSYSGLDILSMDDGRINVLLAGKPTVAGGREYARVVTMSMDGVIIGDESYIEGSNSVPVRIINQAGKRYLLGLAETGFSKGDTPEALKYITYDSWLLGLGALTEYKDSCGAAPTRTLDDLP